MRAAPGGRPARRRDQPRLRLRRDDRRRRAREPRPRRHPLHRLDARLPGDVADGRRATSRATATTRASSARPAARTSSSPTRPPTSTRVAAAIVRGSFEYQGQKCSAASRVYAPSNLWPELRERLADRGRAQIAMGDVADFSNFMGAVIDGSSFETQRDAIDEARARGQGRGRRRRRLRRQRGLVRRADRDRDRRSRLPHDARRALRPGRDDATSTTTSDWDGHARARRPRPRRTALTGAVFADDRAAHRAGARRAALRGRQLLRERQADRRRRRPAAVRRRARVGHERQGRLDAGT